jgi:hypothetical protein
MSTTVAEIRMIILESNISASEWAQTLTKRKTGSHMASTGAVWVSVLCKRSDRSCP